MSDTKSPPPDEVTVLGWVIPRPTGRWHQSIIVTSKHVWITPELSFANNQALLAVAGENLDAFHVHVRDADWRSRMQRCNLADVRGLHWNDITGGMSVAGAGDNVIGAMIPDRAAGTKLEPLIKRAIASRVAKRPNRN